LLVDEETQLQVDLNSARAKVGTAPNLHYVRSAQLGTPTVLSCNQIRALVKKSKPGEESDSRNKENGEIDDI
jgi:hypothetical protein